MHVTSASKEQDYHSYSPRLFPSLDRIAKVVVCALAFLGEVATPTFNEKESKKFPYQVARMCGTHEIPTRDGKSACRVNVEDVLSFGECNGLVNRLRNQLKKEMPDTLDSLNFGKSPTTGEDFKIEEGFMFGYGDNKLVLSTNPKRFSNCEKAYSFIQDKILKEASFFEKDEEGILSTILKSHELIADHMPSEVSPGEFRTQSLIVMDEGIERSLKGMYDELKKRGGTSRELKKIKSIFQKMSQDIKLTAQENTIFKKISPAAVDPSDVEPEMRAFAATLKEEMLPIEQGTSTRDEVIETAAWIHQEIIRIHPFADANGRLARLWLNTALELGGISSVIFPAEEEYIRNTDADLRGEDGAFVRYIKETIEANKEIQRKLTHQVIHA